jgi:hypothetical protein
MSTCVRRAVHGVAIGIVAIVSVALASPAAAQAPAPAPSAKCVKANSKVATDEKWVAKSQVALERTQKASTTCSTKPVCDRFAIKLREIQQVKAKREARLAKAKAVAARVCAMA